MLLYHGTTKKDAEKIFSDQSIKINSASAFEFNLLKEHIHSNTHFLYETTAGYVYLTNWFANAVWHAYIKDTDPKDDLYIFRFELDEHKLECDYDELNNLYINNDKNISVIECLDQTNCVRINENINFKKVSVEYCVLEYDFCTSLRDSLIHQICRYRNNNLFIKKNLGEFLNRTTWTNC